QSHLYKRQWGEDKKEVKIKGKVTQQHTHVHGVVNLDREAIKATLDSLPLEDRIKFLETLRALKAGAAHANENPAPPEVPYGLKELPAPTEETPDVDPPGITSETC